MAEAVLYSVSGGGAITLNRQDRLNAVNTAITKAWRLTAPTATTVSELS